MINAVKINYWNSIDVVLHSSDIRKLKGPFAALLKKEIKEQFYLSKGDDSNHCDAGEFRY